MWVVHPLSRTALLLGKVSARVDWGEELPGFWGMVGVLGVWVWLGKGFWQPGYRVGWQKFSWFGFGKLLGVWVWLGKRFLQPGSRVEWKKKCLGLGWKNYGGLVMV